MQEPLSCEQSISESAVEAKAPPHELKPTHCKTCPLYTAAGPVFSEGPENADVFAIAEAPGLVEVTLNRTLIGGSGRVFRKQCRLAGVDPSTLRLGNIVKCHPVGPDGKDRTPTKDEIAHCRRYIDAEIASSPANLFIAIGDTALKVLSEKPSISKWRGIVHKNSAGRKVLGVFHPAFVMRQHSYWPVNVFDLGRVRAEREFPEVRFTELRTNTNAKAYVDGPAMYAKALAAGYITHDLETTNLDPATSQMICFGIGVDPDEGECYMANDANMPLLKDLYLDPRIMKVGQNSDKFDIVYTEHKLGVEMKGLSFDTMIAFHLTNSSLPKDLSFISSFYSDHEPWKEDKGDLALYNCRDVVNTTRSFLGLRNEIKHLGMEKLLSTVQRLQPVLRRMSKRGLKKDVYYAAALSKQMRDRIAEQESNLVNIIGRPLNPRSPKALMTLFYEEMGLPIQYVRDTKTRHMRPTCNAAAMDALSKLTVNPIFHYINDIRKAGQQCATFVETESDENDFVHPEFGAAKAATGRLNSENPNGQNIPVPLRRLYIPDSPDHLFVEFDWSQIEWRLFCILAADKTGMEILKSGKDNHRAVGSEVLSKDYDAVTEDERQASKFVVYGLGYGRSAKSIAKSYNLPLPFVESFVRKFAARFKDIWEYRENLVKTVNQDSYLANPFGRRRWWFDNMVTEVYNFPAQSTAADMMYVYLIEFEEARRKYEELRISVHDSATNCVLIENLRDCILTMKAIAERMWPEIVEASVNPALVKEFYPNGWFCPADITLGTNWAECKNKKAQLPLRHRFGITDLWREGK